MLITSELAQPIIGKIAKVAGRNINIMDADGVIVASSDPERIHQVHQGAIEVMEMKSERLIYPSECGNLMGTKPGVNLPILYLNECIGTVGITGDPKEVYNIASIVKITVEALLQQHYLSGQLNQKRKVIQEWALDLVNPHFTNFIDLEKRAEFLKMNTVQLCTFVLVEVGDFTNKTSIYDELSEKQERILQLMSLYFTPHFISFIGKDQFMMAFQDKNNHDLIKIRHLSERIYKKLRNEHFDVCIGIGTSKKTIIGYRESYKEASQSIKIIKKLNYPKKVMHIHEWGITRILDKIPEEFMNSYFNEFSHHSSSYLDSELQDTLEMFLDLDLNVELTSKQLNVHRNTVNYRLDKVKQLWGLNPKRFNDAVQLKIFLFFLKINENRNATV
ncbi:CdaR family transcriptional regulator [Fictibacillus sp. NRS-1165]|uniref:CdaR family transcriptional regulator n=1 Tax=Fictibacillus sp. NRS-1165 TaxID=3144463 RepID=UPI003D1AD254